nr:S-layer homology domain-containing protein [Cohnella fermenti]
METPAAPHIYLVGEPEDTGTTDPGDGGTTGSGNSGTTTDGTSVSGGTLAVKASKDAAGQASVQIDAAKLKEAIAQASQGRIAIEIEGGNDAKGLSVTIPSAPLQDAGTAVKEIVIRSGKLEVSLQPDVLKGTGETDSYRLSVQTVDPASLSDSARKAVGDNTVYDFTLTAGSQTIDEFRKGDITVSLPYTLKAGQNPENVIIYYISSSGQLSIVANGHYDAATGTVIFKPAHFSKYSTAYAQVSFADGNQAEWAKTAIEALAAREIVQGNGTGSFLPTAQVTRSEFIQMAIKAFGLASDKATTSLADVRTTDWYYQAVATAESLGIVTGRPDGTFGASDPITKQDMAVILNRLAQVAGVGLSASTGAASAFDDAGTISSYASAAVDSLRKAGIVNGNGNGLFQPTGLSTRAEAATMIYKLLLADR